MGAAAATLVTTEIALRCPAVALAVDGCVRPQVECTVVVDAVPVDDGSDQADMLATTRRLFTLELNLPMLSEDGAQATLIKAQRKRAVADAASGSAWQ